MEATASEVISTFLARLKARVPNLGKAMGTGTGQALDLIKRGDKGANLMSKHLDAIAASLGTNLEGVMTELIGISRQLRTEEGRRAASLERLAAIRDYNSREKDDVKVFTQETMDNYVKHPSKQRKKGAFSQPTDKPKQSKKKDR